jgi:hypothetical protein
MKTVYLIEGPYMGKGGRKYVIAEIDGKRRKINHAKYVLYKAGVDIKNHEEVHHKNGNKDDDRVENLKPMRQYVHKKEDKRIKK